MTEVFTIFSSTSFYNLMEMYLNLVVSCGSMFFWTRTRTRTRPGLGLEGPAALQNLAILYEKRKFYSSSDQTKNQIFFLTLTGILYIIQFFNECNNDCIIRNCL
jgi:hypothetical protein